ncbi:hypothetical protein E4U54_000679, partial [Claviceps lovelessii]
MSSASEEKRPKSQDSLHHDGHRRRLSQQPSNTGSIWIAESLSLPREALFVAVICMAQFCT